MVLFHLIDEGLFQEINTKNKKRHLFTTWKRTLKNVHFERLRTVENKQIKNDI